MDANKENKGEKIGRRAKGFDDQALEGGTKAAPPRPALAKPDAVLTADEMGFADKGRKKIGRPGQGLYVGGTKADPAVPAVVSLRWSAEWIQNRWATSSCARRR
jgi:hypothetical protein